MLKLRRGTIGRIVGLLDESIFTRHAFECGFNNEESGETISVVMRDEPEFYFIARYTEEEEKRYHPWLVEASPSEYFVSSGEQKVSGFDEVLSSISKWLQRVLEDILLPNSGNRESFIGTLRENLELNASELENPEAPFDEDEAAIWEQKIDHVIEQVEDIQEQQELSQEAIDELKEQMAAMKEKIRDIPKKVWVRSIGNRFLNFFERFSGQIAKSIAKGAVEGMLSSPH